MITIKKVESFEQRTWKFFTHFVWNHKIISFICVTLFSLFTASALCIILMLALIGGANIESKWYDMHNAGEITDEAYGVLTILMDLILIDVNYLGDIMVILFITPISIFLYWIYKWYLRYINTNLWR